MASSNSPVRACLDYLNNHPADLIVLAVHQREGRMRWLEKRVGEPIAQRAGDMTLFIPHGVQGFVSREDGSVSLRRILIPVAEKPGAQPAVDAVARAIQALQLASGAVTLLHVGSASEAPSLRTPDDSGWVWSPMTKEGEPSEVILQTADAMNADLIVMTTEGPHGFLDALRGSTSQQVLSKSRCPVASLPTSRS